MFLYFEILKSHLLLTFTFVLNGSDSYNLPVENGRNFIYFFASFYYDLFISIKVTPTIII